MKNKRLYLILLSLALLAFPVKADPSLSGSDAYYVGAGGNSTNLEVIQVMDMPANAKIAKKQVSVSNPDVIQLEQLNNNAYTFDMYTTDMPSVTGQSAVISFRPIKAETCTLFVELNGQTLTKKMTVYPYTNPVKSFTIKGVASGKNLASKFKKNNRVTTAMLSKNTKAGSFTVKAASGWTLTGMEIGTSCDAHYNSHSISFYKNPAKGTLLCPTPLQKKQMYFFYATFKNKQTGGIIRLDYTLNK